MTIYPASHEITNAHNAQALSSYLAEYQRQLVSRHHLIHYTTQDLYHRSLTSIRSLQSSFDAMQHARTEYLQARAAFNRVSIG